MGWVRVVAAWRWRASRLFIVVRNLSVSYSVIGKNTKSAQPTVGGGSIRSKKVTPSRYGCCVVSRVELLVYQVKKHLSMPLPPLPLPSHTPPYDASHESRWRTCKCYTSGKSARRSCFDLTGGWCPTTPTRCGTSNPGLAWR